MKFNRCIAIIAAVFLMISGLATADILPNPVPENQVFTLTSIIDAVGVTTESTSLVWQIGDAGLDQLPPVKATWTGADWEVTSGSIAYVTYSDAITTNGGQISEVKSFSMDTNAKTEGLFNIETTKVLTYTSQNGSHLMGAESYVLDVAGNLSNYDNSIVCVFSKANDREIPAFCNKVTASSKLTSVTTAQVETVGGLTAVAAKSSVPAALNYEISVTPDANSASGYADGIVSTTFTASVMEGRFWSEGGDNGFVWVMYDEILDPWTRFWAEVTGNAAELASTLTYIDTATVAGGISTFNKGFSYQSGVACENC